MPGHWRSDASFADADGPIFYRTSFSLDSPADASGLPKLAIADDQVRTWLRFDGIFYDADVFLNGSYLGDTSGYFFPHTFEITDQLVVRDTHELAVEVNCWPQKDKQAKRNLTGAFQHADYIDPDWNPGGIWQPVHVSTTGPVAIRFFRVICTEASEHSATLAIRAVVDSETAREVVFATEVAGVQHEHPQPLAAGENRVEWTVSITDPELWWPHSLGEQTLHDVHVELRLDDGELSDQRTRRTGFRSVRTDNWVTSINGTRLFLKGINLAPTTRGLADATVEQVEGDMTAAKDAGLDMVRVHSHIARPELYAAADELGLLIWQDFPMHQGYDRSVRGQAGRQAREMVDLLGHHPSVFTWCGHNEPDGRDNSVPAPSLVKSNRPGWNRTVLDRTIKRAIAKNDPSRPIIAHSGVPPHLPLLDGTDSHLWYGWHGVGDATDMAAAAAVMARPMRFVSEFGAQSVPVSADFCEPERWPNLNWDAIAAQHGLDRNVMLHRIPPSMFETFDEWAEATRLYQAFVVKTQIETLRRLKYRPTGGFSVHHLNDSQPAISTSLLGDDRRPKPAYQSLVDACRPVIVTADPFPYDPVPGTTVTLGVHVVNDLQTAAGNAVVRATLHDPTGSFEYRWEGEIEADTVVRVGEVRWQVPSGIGDVTLDLELTGTDVTVTNRYGSSL